MVETEVFQLIGNFGFPIAITIYLLVRFEGKIEGLRNAIDNLTDHLAGLKK
ncbi:YvrJ family protein [Lysinibacillus mangiferihumi]|uniref:YvrJ family protein n=1 Tax=Lysinibacillus mangiferihumi TaxID=1130819 RepID=A0A4U2Z1C9_9BACI|nr:YvrJ family protein [Lysinibacillus mangiferihumi]TKI67818.1 YvrJ family protein [Lysinibacillus mangiferihumi]